METQRNKFSKREEEILFNIVDLVKNELDPGVIILFGSRAKGINRNTSDFDVAVDLNEPDNKIKRRLNEKLDRIRGLYKVDLVFLNNLEDEFKSLILKTGKVIYEI
ncbi:MAG: type VII toxin-antitoxin system MntA family adenylyltransferase antitoxin [Ignavibacteria bacterium]